MTAAPPEGAERAALGGMWDDCENCGRKLEGSRRCVCGWDHIEGNDGSSGDTASAEDVDRELEK